MALLFTKWDSLGLLFPAEITISTMDSLEMGDNRKFKNPLYPLEAIASPYES
jgi:hypothetical protein